MQNIINKIKFWLNAARLYSVPITILSWLTIFVYSLKNNGNALNGIIALIGITLVHLATNLIDDYIDYKVLKQDNEFVLSGRDCKCEYLRTNQASTKDLKNVIILLLSIAAITGIILFFTSGPAVFILAIIALLIALTYPHLSNRGLGEIAVILAYGPLMYEGVYYVMTKSFSTDVLILSFACVMFVNTILYAHMLMDFDGDKKAGKKTLCLNLKTKQNALNMLLVFYTISYILIAYFTYRTNNYYYFITYLTLPLVLNLYNLLKSYNNNPQDLPQIKFWYKPLENWDKIKETSNAPFYLRFFFARNISTYFMLLACLAIILG